INSRVGARASSIGESDARRDHNAAAGRYRSPVSERQDHPVASVDVGEGDRDHGSPCGGERAPIDETSGVDLNWHGRAREVAIVPDACGASGVDIDAVRVDARYGGVRDFQNTAVTNV